MFPLEIRLSGLYSGPAPTTRSLRPVAAHTRMAESSRLYATSSETIR